MTEYYYENGQVYDAENDEPLTKRELREEASEDDE